MNTPRRKALVTGAGRNLGRSIALRLAQAGHDIVIHARADKTQAETVAKEARAFGVEAMVALADIGSRGDLRKMSDQVLKEFGHLDILVNVAALRPFKNFLEMNFEKDWQNVMEANVSSVFFLTQAFLPGMVE